MRSFVAVPVREPIVVERLAAAQQRLAAVADLHRVPPAQLHFTLKFLGDIPAERARDAAAATCEAAASLAPFSLELSGLGAFPRPAAARVIWAGTASGADKLLELAAALERAFLARGFPAADRPFAPHLTLARARLRGRERARASPALAATVALETGVGFGTVEVSELVLFESKLGPLGATHVALERAGLGAA